MSETEGVIKYQLVHQNNQLPGEFDIQELCHWFEICHKAGLIGQDDERYLGYAYGNISQRMSSGFIISGTQTGGKQALTSNDIAWVKHFDLSDNHVESEGLTSPSSETMTHGQIYALCPQVNFIIHAHTPKIWTQSDDLELPATEPEVEYGTVAMAKAVENLVSNQSPPAAFSMKGHEDGIVVYGTTALECGNLILDLLTKAQAR